MRRRLFASSSFVALMTLACAARVAAPAITPAAAVNDLLAADRAFSAASARTDLVTGISAMFAPDVATPVPGARFSVTSTEAIAALRAVAGNSDAHAEWTPVRGGISADGTQGFTLGYMTVHRADNSNVAMKYLSYWVKRPEGWRVAVYRRRPRGAGDAPMQVTMVMPGRMVAPSADASRTSGFGASLDAAERAFSHDAQSIGLDAAFARWGSGESFNMGGPTDAAFVVGSVAIGHAVSTGEPTTGSSVNWAPDRVLIASSGDLGVTIGTIHVNKPAADGSQAAGFPFFTVWHRASTAAPWRYIAE